MLWSVEIFFDQPVKHDLRAYNNNRKIAICQDNDYTTWFLLDYSYLKKNYKLVAIDLIKEPALHTDPREMQQIKFIGDIDRVEDATMFFIIKETKEPI